jgi:glycerol kinase
VWERATGRPIHPAVVWQSRASAQICESLRARGLEPLVRQRTGLVIDAYFSATKVRWILDQVAGAQARAAAGDLLCGTIDTWLVWKLTGGRVHVTDVSNASRTMVFNIHRQRWDAELLAALDLPRAMFATPVPSKGVVGETDAAHFGAPLPIGGIAGDQQAALFGQTCFAAGEAKNTYGTGCFLLANTGATAAPARGGLLTTLAWDIGDGAQYALEGSAFVTGAAVQWLRDELRIIERADEIGPLAASVPDAGGVMFVPAFTGLGSPYWDPYARGTVLGLTRGSGRAQLARAAVEAMAYQTADVVEAVRTASGTELAELRVDGGASVMDVLCQFQADVLGVTVRRPAVQETTALGAAYLAGIAEGVWATPAEAASAWREDASFTPEMDAAAVEARLDTWHRAVARSRDWARE